MAVNGVTDYTIRTMEESEIEETYQLIDKEGWNLTEQKLTHLYRSVPTAFHVAATEAGEIIGTISFFPTFQNEYVLGNIVVKSTHRHKGMGNRLVDYMMSQHPGCVVSCTAVPGADQFYLNVGFSLTEPQQGHDIFHITVNREQLADRCKGDNTIIVKYNENEFKSLANYDHEVKGYRNEAYIAMMVDCFPTYVALGKDGQITGYVAAFVKRKEIVVDGLCADTDLVASHLFRRALDDFPDRSNVKLQVPSSQLFLSQLGTISSSYKYNRYSIGHPTPSPLKRIYNVSDCDYTY